MRLALISIPLIAALAGCVVDPQAAEQRRASLIESTIPNAADRQGVFLVFPVESRGSVGGLNFVYEPSVLSEAEAQRRVSSICERFGRSGAISVSQDLGERSATRGDGSQITVRDMWFDCES